MDGFGGYHLCHIVCVAFMEGPHTHFLARPAPAPCRQSNRSTHDGAECFDAGTGRWLPLGGALLQGRKYLGLAVAAGVWLGACWAACWAPPALAQRGGDGCSDLPASPVLPTRPPAHPGKANPPFPSRPAGRLIAVGGMTGARMRLATAEAYDPREGRWAALPPMSTARSSGGVACLHDCVYVVGGNVGQEVNENCTGVEAWVPAAGRWRECAPISHGRSGLSVAPF